MAKFFFTAAAALCAVFGAAQAQNATQVPCVPLNFSTKAADFKSLNAVVDLAISSGLLKTSIPDPITVNETVISAIPFKVLNLNFELTPTLKKLTFGGLSSILPQHLNVSSANSVVIAADINGSATLDATFSISIQQLDLKWYSICWTDAIHAPFTCPPAVIDVSVQLDMTKPTIVADLELDMVACAAGLSTKICKNVTVSDILIAALSSKFDTLLTRLLKRFSAAKVKTLTIGWESISKLNVDIAKSGSLINAILDALVNFSVGEVNKKGDIYNTVIDVVQKLATSVINNLFSTSLAPQFGNTCYDA
ncbi:hypothetical protein Gpo141_00011965 [Globisporangium polare]